MLPILTIMYLLHHQQEQKGANNNTNFLKEIENAPKDRYLQSKVSIDGFNMTADLALTSEQRGKRPIR